MKLPRRHGLTIEKYALLTENAPELGAELDEWHGFYRGASPGERTLLDMAVMATVHLRRILACLTETANQQVRTAVFHFDCEQEDEIQRFRDMLETRPGVAVVGLKRSALGCRFLILRWERLLRLLESDGTLYGKDRDEAIHYQGARATDPANLFESEGAYLTWIYCLMAQPDPRDEDFVEIGNKSWMPSGLNDRKIHHWLGDDALSRKLLKEIAERELAALRPREERLRKNYEEPARDGVEIRNQFIQGPVGARLVREMELHDRQFHRAYGAFLKGRNQSEKTGRLPGASNPELHGTEDDSPTAARAKPEPPSMSAEEAAAQRKREAAALAPAGENGIGAPTVRGDLERAGVMASGPLSQEELVARAAATAAAEAATAGTVGG